MTSVWQYIVSNMYMQKLNLFKPIYVIKFKILFLCSPVVLFTMCANQTSIDTFSFLIALWQMNILGWSRWIPRRTVLINWQPNLKDNHAKKKK